MWMDHFSTEHGFVAVNGQFTRTNKLSGEECVVSIEVHYPKATGTSPKTAITELNLADFDPKVKLDIDEKEGKNDVAFERTDEEMKTRAVIEYANGGKLEIFSAEAEMFFNSKESAQRFARALAHAITLCGGVSAPF